MLVPCSFRPFLLLAVVAALVIVAAPHARAADGAGAEPPLAGRWQIRGALHDADEALAQGRLDEAGRLYRQVIASTSADDGHRAQALYGVALVEMTEMTAMTEGTEMVEASAPSEPRGMAQARAALEELASSFPSFERGPEIAAARSCLDALDRDGSRTEDQEKKIAELEAQLAERTGRLAAKNAAAGDRVAELEAEGEALRTEGEALRTQLAELQKKLSSAQAELEKKEEALEQVKKTLISGG